jgi:hypothetical protein
MILMLPTVGRAQRETLATVGLPYYRLDLRSNSAQRGTQVYSSPVLRIAMNGQVGHLDNPFGSPRELSGFSFAKNLIVRVTTEIIAHEETYVMRIESSHVGGSPIWARSIRLRRRPLRTSVLRRLADSTANFLRQRRSDIEEQFYATVRESLPLSLQVGEDGSAWVSMLNSDGHVEWLVFSPDGNLPGAIVEPVAGRILGVAADRAVAVVDEGLEPRVVSLRVRVRSGTVARE